MTLTRLACPTCGAGVTSAAGFAAGQVAKCPTCEREFTVDEADLRSPQAAEAADELVPGASRAEEVEWSYRNSTLRYVVLAVLLVVLGVLAYMLYDKKTKERLEAAQFEEERRAAEATVPKDLMPLPGAPVAAGAERTVGDPVAAMKSRLVGVWQAKFKGESIAVEYKPDGSFTYTVAKDDKAAKTLAGKWHLAALDVKMKGVGSKTFEMQLEWTPEGQPVVKEGARVNPNQTMTHPLLDREEEGKRPTADFVLQKKK